MIPVPLRGTLGGTPRPSPHKPGRARALPEPSEDWRPCIGFERLADAIVEHLLLLDTLLPQTWARSAKCLTPDAAEGPIVRRPEGSDGRRRERKAAATSEQATQTRECALRLTRPHVPSAEALTRPMHTRTIWAQGGGPHSGTTLSSHPHTEPATHAWCCKQESSRARLPTRDQQTLRTTAIPYGKADDFDPARALLHIMIITMAPPNTTPTCPQLTSNNVGPRVAKNASLLLRGHGDVGCCRQASSAGPSRSSRPERPCHRRAPDLRIAANSPNMSASGLTRRSPRELWGHGRCMPLCTRGRTRAHFQVADGGAHDTSGRSVRIWDC